MASGLSALRAAPEERPMIWVRPSDRPAILAKIDQYPWAESIYNQLRARADSAVIRHKQGPALFFENLHLANGSPLQYPTFGQIPNDISEGTLRNDLMQYLQEGIECGVLYYLTENEDYAKCAADTLTAVVGALSRFNPSTSVGNGGWIMTTDHLKEARVFGAQIPIIYDFVAPYLAQGNMVNDPRTNLPGAFPFELAQEVFRTYADLAITHGYINTNWPVLESPSLVRNALALEDPTERTFKLSHYTTRESTRQDPISKIAKEYETDTDLWPESLQYASAVGEISTALIATVDGYDPSNELFTKYRNIPASLLRTSYLRYPNGEYIVFGDGPRTMGAPYFFYEIAYMLAEKHGDADLRDRYGSLINQGIASGVYSRSRLDARSYGASPYFTPLHLLWFSGEVEGAGLDFTPPRTDKLPFAGIHLQRNVETDDAEMHGLMGFVGGGGGYVHGHATGMDMELYGYGEVLGAKAGHATYTSEIQQNYYRLFAGHNTVIVNGKSGSKGGWAQLGLNEVKTKGMEPMPFEAAVSPHHSFSTTTFVDNKQPGTDATQERTLAVIRTSPTTGYYVDVFRSKSTIPNSFHDYVYHNIGDDVEISKSSVPLPTLPDNSRYSGSASLPWSGNSTFRHPGWHYFETAATASSVSGTVVANFKATLLSKPAQMRMIMPSVVSRDYTTAMAPSTLDAPSPYGSRKTPTLVVRHQGDAWNQPFAAVFEPSAVDGATIEEVTTLEKDGTFVGLKIVSHPPQGVITQYVLLLEDLNGVYIDATLGLSMIGRFGVVTLDENEAVKSLYLGDGTRLAWGDTELLGGIHRSGFLDGASETWRGMPVTTNPDGSKWADTGSWMGWIEITNEPFVYVLDIDRWAFMGELTDFGSWLYFFR